MRYKKLTTRVSKLEELFSDEITSYHFRNTFSKLLPLWQNAPARTRSLRYNILEDLLSQHCLVPTKFLDHHLTTSSNRPRALVALFSELSPHSNNFLIKFYTYGIGSLTVKSASILFTLFPGDYDKLLQWPFSKLNPLGIRDKLDPLNTRTYRIWAEKGPAYK